MNNYFLSKKFLLLLLALGVTAILFGIAISVISQYKPKANPTTYKAPFSEQKQVVNPNQLPTGMPSTLPVEKDVTIIENSTSTTSNNAMQATRIFESKKTLEESFAIYEKFFTDNNWTIMTRINDANNKVLSAKNGQSTMQISMSANEQTKVSRISIYYVQPINAQ